MVPSRLVTYPTLDAAPLSRVFEVGPAALALCGQRLRRKFKVLGGQERKGLCINGPRLTQKSFEETSNVGKTSVT